MASDPLADMQNILGYQGLVGNNPYLAYQGQIPLAGYALPPGSPTISTPQGNVAVPTDAMGNPIQIPPGMTLNSPPPPPAPAPPPTAPAAPAQSPIVSQLASNAAMQRVLQNQAQGMSGGMGGTTGSGNQAPTSYGDPIGLAIGAHGPLTSPYAFANNAAAMGITPQIMAARQAAFMAPGASASSIAAQEQPGGPLYAAPPGSAPAATAAPAAPAGPPGPPVLTREQYLTLLANPGKPAATGAQPPLPGQTLTGTPGPNIVNAFLAANKNASTPFLNTLRATQQGQS
jgi:hypothetical protein